MPSNGDRDVWARGRRQEAGWPPLTTSSVALFTESAPGIACAIAKSPCVAGILARSAYVARRDGAGRGGPEEPGRFLGSDPSGSEARRGCQQKRDSLPHDASLWTTTPSSFGGRLDLAPKGDDSNASSVRIFSESSRFYNCFGLARLMCGARALLGRRSGVALAQLGRCIGAAQAPPLGPPPGRLWKLMPERPGPERRGQRNGVQQHTHLFCAFGGSPTALFAALGVDEDGVCEAHGVDAGRVATDRAGAAPQRPRRRADGRGKLGGG